MKNIISKSIFFILFCFIFISLIIFLIVNNYSLNTLYYIIKYIIFNEKGLVIFLAQFLFIFFVKDKSVSAIILNVIVCWIIYNIINYFKFDLTYIPKINSLKELYIYREIIDEHKFNPLYLPITKKIIYDIQNWTLVVYSPISSFIILIFSGSLEYYVDNNLKNNYIVKVLTLVVIFLFLLYIWNYSFNSILFILSIYLFKIRRKIV